MGRKVGGRLVFAQGGPARPLHHAPYRARLHHALGPEEGLSDGRTDLDGRFWITVPDGDAKVHLLLLETHPRYGADGELRDESTEAASVRFEVPAGADDVGDLPVAWWPYRTDFPTPRVAAVDGALPQPYTRGYFHALERAVAETLPSQALLKAEHALDRSGPSMATIQKHQPKTLTLRVEAETPGRTRGDAWLADQLLNGFDIALEPVADPDVPGRVIAAVAWGEVPPAGEFDLSDFRVVLDDVHGTLLPTSITLRIRSAPAGGAWTSDTTRTFAPGDAHWEAAKRVVRCQYLLHGALEGHITRTHLQTELAAIAVFRNLRSHPARTLLVPHLQEIVAQDHDGDSFAWGPDGILCRQSSLPAAELQARMARHVASRRWETFRPRAPLHASDRYARAAALYWDLLGDVFGTHLAAHAAESAAAWPEVRRMSDDLRAHGPIGEPWSYAPITTADAPAPGDDERLLQWCRCVVFHATFDHTWTHDGQYDAGGELRYATFGLRNGSLGAEDDPAIAPSPESSIQAISTNSIGTRANHGYLLADEERDVPPLLKAALLARADAFAALGVDVARLRSRINI